MDQEDLDDKPAIHVAGPEWLNVTTRGAPSQQAPQGSQGAAT